MDNVALFLKLLFTNVKYIKILKDIAMDLWKAGILSDSEHCDIEAYLDSKLYSMIEKAD